MRHHEPDFVALRWDGAHTVKAARSAMRGHNPVAIELPLNMHYVLYAHLHPELKHAPAQDIDAAGGAELLVPIASVAGLHELEELAPAVRRARYRVRLTSPDPLIRLLPPAPERAGA
jgi:hypothetical protein